VTTLEELDSANGGGPVERDPDDFKRDANGTPYVSDPAGEIVKTGKRKGEPKWVRYGRPSSFGKDVENTYNLTKWNERRIVLGLALEGGLEFGVFGRIAEAADAQQSWESDADGIIARSKRAAKAFEAGEQGTHAHSLTQDDDEGASWLTRAEAGEDLGIPRDAQAGIVEAWRLLLSAYGLEVLHVETKVVNDRYKQAGTLDRIVRLTRDLTFAIQGEKVTVPAGTVLVLDIKSGKLKLDYWNSYAVQIHTYASALPYDTRTEVRGTWDVDICQRWALIAHLPVADAIAGEPKGRLILVDLDKGRAAAELCMAARYWQQDRAVFGLGLDIEFVTPVPAVPAAVLDAAPVEPGRYQPGDLVTYRGAQCTVNVDNGEAVYLPDMPDRLAVRDTHPKAGKFGGPPLLNRWASKEHVTPVAKPKAYEIPAVPDEPVWRATMPDESELMAQPEQAPLVQQAYAKRSPDKQAIVDMLLKDAQRAGVPFGQLVANPTVRRFEAARVAFRIADHLDGDDELTRAAIRLVLGDRPEVAHAPLGALVGCLTPTEARALCLVLEDVGAGLIVADYSNGPALRRAA
jgi:hypothetical protein